MLHGCIQFLRVSALIFFFVTPIKIGWKLTYLQFADLKRSWTFGNMPQTNDKRISHTIINSISHAQTYTTIRSITIILCIKAAPLTIVWTLRKRSRFWVSGPVFVQSFYLALDISALSLVSSAEIRSADWWKSKWQYKNGFKRTIFFAYILLLRGGSLKHTRIMLKHFFLGSYRQIFKHWGGSCLTSHNYQLFSGKAIKPTC